MTSICLTRRTNLTRQTHPTEPIALPTNLIDGRAIASQLLAELGERVTTLKKRGIQPGLVFVRVGEDPASKVYVGRKEKACEPFMKHNPSSERDHHGRQVRKQG